MGLSPLDIVRCAAFYSLRRPLTIRETLALQVNAGWIPSVSSPVEAAPRERPLQPVAPKVMPAMRRNGTPTTRPALQV